MRRKQESVLTGSGSNDNTASMARMRSEEDVQRDLEWEQGCLAACGAVIRDHIQQKSPLRTQERLSRDYVATRARIAVLETNLDSYHNRRMTQGMARVAAGLRAHAKTSRSDQKRAVKGGERLTLLMEDARLDLEEREETMSTITDLEGVSTEACTKVLQQFTDDVFCAELDGNSVPVPATAAGALRLGNQTQQAHR